MAFPADHPDRRVLNDEVHARPSDTLAARTRISYMALLGGQGIEALERLCGLYGRPPPPGDANHFIADLGEFGVRWERHTEFTRYSFIVPAADEAPFSATAISRVPGEWLRSLSGELLVADHVEVVPTEQAAGGEDRLSNEYFGGNVLIGSSIAGGLGRAYTDFRIHDDGFGRFLVAENGMSPRQRGRTVQRLLEIDTYRMLSLLALPRARALLGPLARFENELNEITTAMTKGGAASEPELLDRLTLLQAAIVSELTGSQFRFAAAKAYSQLVGVRIRELRESRIQGLQTYSEFTERRLAPAMRTCEAVAGRLDTVSERVSRATQLLSTRVDISRENQNQALLESMDRRAKMQLRLQQTVEGLSIAAITYYVVGLVSYALDGVYALDLLPVEKDVVTMASIPLVALAIAYAIRTVRRSLHD